MRRFAAPALAGAAVLGVVTAGAAVVSPMVSADADLAGATFSPSKVAATAPATAAPELSAPVPQDSVAQVQALAKGVALSEERADRARADAAAAEAAAAEAAAAEAAEAEAAAAEAAPEPAAVQEETGSGGSCESSGFNGVAPHVAEAGHHLQQKFGVEDVGGVAERGNSTSDHPRGYALDFMVDESTGDALAAYAEENTEALGIKYILWQVEDHYDHVHLSFTDEPGSGLPC